MILEVRTFTTDEINEIAAAFSKSLKGWLSWVQSNSKPGTAEYEEAVAEIRECNKQWRRFTK